MWRAAHAPLNLLLELRGGCHRLSSQAISADAVRPSLPSVDRIALDLYGINFQKDQERCPFPDRHNHGDRDKSLRFDRGKGRIFCASQQCFGENGVDAFGLVQKMDGVTFPQAVEKLAERYSAAPVPPIRPAARKTSASVRASLERDGWDFKAEGYFGDFIRQVRFEHRTKLQPKGRPEKTFLWEHRDGDDEWYSGTGGREIPPYLNKTLRKGEPCGALLLVEGWGKADAADAMGIAAASLKEITETNADCFETFERVVIWPDHDPAGAKLAAKAAEYLFRHNKNVYIIEPPADFPASADIVDAIALGWTVEQILDLMAHAKPAVSPDQCAIQRIEDLLPMAAFGNTEAVMIVEQVLGEGTITVVTGEPGCGKSTTVAHMVYCVSRGIPFAGRSTIQRPVLWNDREDPISAVAPMHDRLGIAEHDGFRVWGMWQPEEPPEPDAPIILDYIARCNPKPIIVLNPLVAFWGGDENDAKQTRAFMSRLRRLAAMGATIIGIHHIGKSESSKDFRGSSDLKAAIDLGLKVTNTSDTPGRLDKVTVAAFKDRMGIFTEARLRYKTGGFVPDQFAVSLTNTDRLVQLLRDNPRVQKVAFLDLAKSEGLGRNRAEAFLESGVRNGSISVENGTRNSRLFSWSQEAN